MTTRQWMGGSGDWNSADNWAPAGVPGPADTALIDASGVYTVTVDDSEQAQAVTLDTAGATLAVVNGGTLATGSGGVTVGGQLTIGTLAVDGESTISGVLNLNRVVLAAIDPPGQFNGPGVTLDNPIVLGNTTTLQGGTTLQEDVMLSAAPGTSLTLTGPISSANPMTIIELNGGKVILSGINTVTPDFNPAPNFPIYSLHTGTLDLTDFAALGSASLDFPGDGAPTLAIGVTGNVTNEISGFTTADTIDLTALPFPGATISTSGDLVTVSNGSQFVQLDLVDAAGGLNAALHDDGAGGTDFMLIQNYFTVDSTFIYCLGGNGDWTTPGDWSLGSVPTGQTPASIAIPGNYTVTVTGSQTAQSLILNDPGATLDVTVGATLDSDQLTLTAGTLQVDGLLSDNSIDLPTGITLLLGFALSQVTLSGGLLRVTGTATIDLLTSVAAVATVEVAPEVLLAIGTHQGGALVVAGGGAATLALTPVQIGNAGGGVEVLGGSTLAVDLGLPGNGVVVMEDSPGSGSALNYVGGGASTLVGTAGNDTVQAGSADLLVFAGSGMMHFDAGSGSSTVVGQSGTVTVSGDAGGRTTVFGNSGETVSLTGQGTSTIVGGPGSETLDGSLSTGDSLYFSGDGSDVIAAGGGAHTVVGTAGAATVQGGSGDLLLFRGSGPMTFINGSGSSTVVAGSGAVTISGNGTGAITGFADAGGALYLRGGSSGGIFVTDLGSETLDASGSTGSNVFFGSTSDDVIRAGDGQDTIVAGGGSTTIFGGNAGGVAIFEGSGADVVNGGVGAAYIQAGSGTAVDNAGSGAEVFAFVNGDAGGSDMIAGFQHGIDALSLNGYGAGAEATVLAGAVIAGGSTTLTLPDHTVVTLIGLDDVTAGDFVS